MESAISELKARTSGTRYVELDGLRGLAALSVLGHHFLFVYDIRPRWFEIPLAAGHEAVMLFFMLSGFVLSLPYWNGRRDAGYAGYIVRRAFRIYVPYAAAVAVAVIGDLLWGHKLLPLDSWYYLTWQSKVTLHLVLNQLAMSPSPELNTAFWSLRYEVQFSIALPLMLALLSRLRLLAGLMGCVFVVSIATLLQRQGVADHFSWLETIRYMPIFLAGALLARDRVHVQTLWNGLWPALRLLFVLTAGSLYWGYEHYLLRLAHLDALQRSLTVCGAAGILIVSLNVENIRRILCGSVCEYLGRISFSVYLIHGTVLFALINNLYWRLSRPWMGTLFIVLSIALGHLFCVGVEEPSLKLGRRLAGAFPVKSHSDGDMKGLASLTS